jgi:hypothetical protein
MVALVLAMVLYFRCLVLTRHRLALESAALRQQPAIFKRKQPRPRLQRFDRLFWVALQEVWLGWSDALIIVQPETVVSWIVLASVCSGGGGLSLPADQS